MVQTSKQMLFRLGKDTICFPSSSSNSQRMGLEQFLAPDFVFSSSVTSTNKCLVLWFHKGQFCRTQEFILRPSPASLCLIQISFTCMDSVDEFYKGWIALKNRKNTYCENFFLNINLCMYCL